MLKAVFLPFPCYIFLFEPDTEYAMLKEFLNHVVKDLSDVQTGWNTLHLPDTFIQTDLQTRRTIEAIRPTREQRYTSTVTSLS